MSRLTIAWVLVAAIGAGCGGDSATLDAAGIDAAAPSPDAGTCTTGPAAPGDPVTAVHAWQHDTSVSDFPEGSPSLCDLDHDGRFELIAPIAPPGPQPGKVVVLDSVTGAALWETPLAAGSFPAPYCIDVDDDGIDDVLTSGRTGDVIAFSGADGTALWTLGQGDPDFLLAGNTYAIVAESVDADLLFVSKGGGGTPSGGGPVRPDVPGRMIAFDRLGNVVSTWFEPDEAEIYSAPAIARGPADELLLAIGSGGERLGGTLFVLEYDEQAATFAERASLPSACATGGFVSSPLFGDVDGDGSPDVVGIDYCGRVHAIDIDGGVLWTHVSDVAFGTANALLADLNGDDILDVVAAFESFNFSFPDETGADPKSELVALDGPSGEPIWSYPTNQWIFSSPVSADFDGDGTEDVLSLVAGMPPPLAPELTVLSGVSGDVLYTEALGNTASTPIIGDVDDDGDLDVLFCDVDVGQQRMNVTRLEFCGRPYVPAASESGFRGYPVHDGHRP